MRVAIYCRLSDEDRGKIGNEDSESIENQKRMLTSYAMSKGWQIFDIYSDDDWSGLDAERPEWNRMLIDAETHKFDIVLCKHQYRFTRDIEIVEKYLHKLFPIWGIRFVGLTDNADTDNADNKKQRQLNGLTGEWYCEDISKWIRASFDQKRKDGYFIGSLACYGYMKDPNEKGKLIIDEEAAAIVKRIFNMYLDGNGCNRIAALLNSEEIPNPTRYKNRNGVVWKKLDDGGGLWNKTTIRRILRNQMYLGHMVQGCHRKVSFKDKAVLPTKKEEWFIVPNQHEAIVEEGTFALVEEMLKSKRRHDGSGEKHATAGKIRCADCGSTMEKVTPQKKDGTPFPYKYLRCSLQSKKRGRCTGHLIRLDKVEAMILSCMQVYFENINEEYVKEHLGDIKQKKLNKEKELIDKIKSCEKRLKDNESAKMCLYRDRVEEKLSVDEFNELTTVFKKDNQSVKDKITDLTEQLNDLKNQEDSEESLIEKIKTYKNPTVLTARLVNEFIEVITIGEKNKETGKQEVKIVWKY